MNNEPIEILDLNNEVLEELIVSELKIRRKKEIKHGKTAQR